MVLPGDIAYTIKENGIKALNYHPDNLCTIEHPYSKLSPYRRDVKKHPRRLMICCRKCNEERGNEEYRQLSKEEKRGISGSKPLSEKTTEALLEILAKINKSKKFDQTENKKIVLEELKRREVDIT